MVMIGSDGLGHVCARACMWAYLLCLGWSWPCDALWGNRPPHVRSPPPRIHMSGMMDQCNAASGWHRLMRKGSCVVRT